MGIARIPTHAALPRPFGRRERDGRLPHGSIAVYLQSRIIFGVGNRRTSARKRALEMIDLVGMADKLDIDPSGLDTRRPAPP